MSPRALRRQIGQLLMAGFEGQQIPVELRSLAREFGLSGVILFARNIGEAEQVAELSRELQETARDAGHDLPLVIGVDQEGGRVARMGPPWTVWPPLRALGLERAPVLEDVAAFVGRAQKVSG